ncbi:MAG TPA: glycosyltransferase family 4 protein [Burkholderiales bacterium]|nr:glycosyltransferase family 4 protein [Burkholderiales bacterium]
MKLALVSSLYAPNGHGGAERVVQDLAEGLAALGHAVHVLCLGRGDRVERARLNGVEVRYCPLRNLYWPFPVSPAGLAGKVAWHAIDAHNARMARIVDGLLEEVAPELVNTHNIAGFSAAVWAPVARRGLPLVHTLHDHYLLCPYSTMHRGGRNCERPCLACRAVTAPRRALTRHVDGVIGVSRYILERHRALGLFAQANAQVVYNGFGEPVPPAPRATGPALRIGFLGSLVPPKGADRLVDAFLRLAPGAAELHLAGAGDPGYETELRRRTASRRDVHWRGVVQADLFLAELDLLVVPSIYHDPMPRVVLEAFRQGVPVAGARRGGIPEGFAGDCGWLYDPDDPAALAAILAEAVASPERLRRMREAARAAVRRCSLGAMLEGYLHAYRVAIARRAAPAAIASR